MNRERPGLLRRGEVRGAGDHLPRRLQPLQREARLERQYRGAFHPHLCIPPVFGVLGVARPEIGHPGAAREADAPVNDQRFTVRAVVEAVDDEQPDRVIPADLTPTIFELSYDFEVIPVRPDRIEQELYLYAGARFRHTGVGELLPDLPSPQDESFEGDGALRLADGLQHSRVELVAVG